jgi:hypothetical protein
MARTKSYPFVVSVERQGERGQLTGYENSSLVDAKTEAERRYGPGICTVAVMQAGKLVDVFDGRWSSESAYADD